MGFDVGMDPGNIDNVGRMWTRLNVTNVWHGEGITNCLNPIATHQLEKLEKERDHAGSIIKKVYRWTVDVRDSIRLALSYGMDGIMTNHPERVTAILQEPEFAQSFRLATIYDNPFIKHIGFKTAKSHQPKSYRQTVASFLRDLRESVYYYAVDVVQSLLFKFSLL